MGRGASPEFREHFCYSLRRKLADNLARDWLDHPNDGHVAVRQLVHAQLQTHLCRNLGQLVALRDSRARAFSLLSD
jgi:hypothetical protein